MRRKDKEITDKFVIESIIKKADICRLGMVNGDRPYVIPLNFGYHENSLYFHGSSEGQKLNILQKNSNVCFEIDINIEPVESENACSWSMKYQSVIGFGRAVFIEDLSGKREALNIIMAQYSEKSYRFPEKVLKETCVFKVIIESLSGKQSGMGIQ